MLRRCLARGLARALRPPGLLAALWALQLASALPAALLVEQAVEEAIGGSLVHQRLRAGMDLVWLGEFEDGAEGVATTFTPPALGRTAHLVNLEAAFWGDLFQAPTGMVAMGLGYAALWTFLLGGVLERFAGDRPLPSRSMLAAAGRNFARLLRLALLAGAATAAFYALARRLFPWLTGLMGQVTEERTVLSVYLAAALALALLWAALQLLFDYARIAAVARDERRTLAALRQAAGLLRRRWLPALGIYAICGLAGIALLAAGFALDPGVAQSTSWGVAGFLLFAQLLLAARLAVRLTLLAAQTDLFLRPA